MRWALPGYSHLCYTECTEMRVASLSTWPTRQDCGHRTNGATQRVLQSSPDLASETADAAWTPPAHGRVLPVPHALLLHRCCGAHAAPLLVEEAGWGSDTNGLCRGPSPPGALLLPVLGALRKGAGSPLVPLGLQ
ncbi:hypothetical protein NDU88_006675 [Pleurodeles waltl]|uniref:Uncharacterized protein n=1 Tax=Pleurodeles waltl TaxID=8319 RepID=A0AAV7MEP9_PLEWA|nr:hypothetical protein NDU88_006675 [Pleurodeles waltl]